MYTRHSAAPKKFGRAPSTFRAKSRFGGGTTKFNNSRPAFKRGGGGNKRSRGDRIDFSRFIKKVDHKDIREEAPYISKHTFADFPFNPQLHKNIKGAGYTNPRPIQDQSIPTILKGKDVFGMANT